MSVTTLSRLHYYNVPGRKIKGLSNPDCCSIRLNAVLEQQSGQEIVQILYFLVVQFNEVEPVLPVQGLSYRSCLACFL